MENKHQEQPKQRQTRKTVLIAGATGYLGRHLVSEFLSRKEDNGEEWHVMALVRKPVPDFPPQVQQIVAQATDRNSLEHVLLSNDDNDDTPELDLVVSALGITRQRDGLSYWDVDYQANINLLEVAIQAKVPQFAYIHVINGPLLTELGVDGVAAKQAFVNELETTSGALSSQDASKAKIRSTVLCPTGFYSDMKDFLDMALQGRVYLFGDGERRINPIHGADLAKVTADACNQGRNNIHLDIGGPDIYTHRQLAELAFAAIANGGKNTSNDSTPQQQLKITHLPDWIRKVLLWIVPWVTPKHIGGPAQMFLTAFGFDMVGECHGTHHLQDFYTDLLKEEEKKDQ